MSKPRYLESLLHLLTDDELVQICEARILEAEGHRAEKIKRIMDEPSNPVPDQDYLQLLSSATLQRVCRELSRPWIETESNEPLMAYATRVFRDIDWSAHVILSESEPPMISSNTDTHRAWKDIAWIGTQECSSILKQPPAIDLLVEWTGESETNILRILQNSQPSTIVKRALAHVWPSDEEDSSSSEPGSSSSPPVLPRPVAVSSSPKLSEESDNSSAVEEPEQPQSSESLETSLLEHRSLEKPETEDAFWFLDDWMHEFYVWLRSKRTVHKHPRRGRREILLQYPGLHREHYTLVFHFDGITPVSPEQLASKLKEYTVFDGKPITSLAVLAHAFQKETVTLLQNNRLWSRHTALFVVTPHHYQILHQEKQLRSFSLLRQFLDQRKQQQTLRADIPDLSLSDETSFVDSLHDAPTNKGIVPFQSVVVRQNFPDFLEESNNKTSSQETFDALRPGHVLVGRYVFLRFLQESEMGKAFLVRDQQSDLDCILKVIRPVLARETTWQTQFLQQWDTWSVLSKHPNIAAYYECSVDPEQRLMFFTTEAVDGKTLEWLLQESTKIPVLPWTQMLAVIQSLANTLTHIHNRGYVHRDIKPDNIVVLANQDIKLLDFGFLLQEAPRADRVCSSIWQSSTVSMPHSSDVRAQSYDMYAFAALVFRMLTGVYPDPGELQRPSRWYPQYPTALDSLLLQALGSDTSERPSSALLWARQLRQVLQPLLESATLEAEPLHGMGVSSLSNPATSSSAPSRPSSVSQRPGTGSVWREFWLNLYTTFFRYSLTKQAIEQRKRRLRVLFGGVGVIALLVLLLWWLAS